MSNELVKMESQNKVDLKKDINKEHDLSVIEQVVMQGDLSKLNAVQRVTYYHTVCNSIGLNPYTRPFDYISLNGKLTLYARKDATEQLRGVKKISITELDGRLIDDLYIVKATAKTPDGRTDQSTGAVLIGNLKGEAKANAIMKAETKAKRRVTLSISGLGWTDESEIESIPNAQKVDVDLETGEIKIDYINTLHINQIKELINLHSKPNDIEKKLMDKYSTYVSIPIDKYDSIIKHIMALLKLDEQIKEQSVSVKPENVVFSETPILNIPEPEIMLTNN